MNWPCFGFTVATILWSYLSMVVACKCDKYISTMSPWAFSAFYLVFMIAAAGPATFFAVAAIGATLH
jgi:hypothetical protein